MSDDINKDNSLEEIPGKETIIENRTEEAIKDDNTVLVEESVEKESVGEVQELISQQAAQPLNLKKPKKRKRGFSLERRRAIAGYLFTLPFIIGVIVFMLYPLGTSFVWSLHTSSGVSTREVIDSNGEPVLNEYGEPVYKGGFWLDEFVGAGNYTELISNDYDFTMKFLETIQRTFLWTPFIIVFSLFIAIMLNKKIKFRGVFRVIYFLPVLLGTGLVLSRVSEVTDMITLPTALQGSIRYLIGNEAIEGFLLDLINNIINMFWKMGVQIIIFLAGLQGISESYYEAARVDSANWWDMLWKVTIPMISPMILLNAVYTIIDSFRDSTNPIVEYIINEYNKGSAYWIRVSTMGWIYFLVTLLMLGIVFAATRRFIFYEK